MFRQSHQVHQCQSCWSQQQKSGHHPGTPVFNIGRERASFFPLAVRTVTGAEVVCLLEPFPSTEWDEQKPFWNPSVPGLLLSVARRKIIIHLVLQVSNKLA